MKLLPLLLIALFISNTIYSQDILIKKSGEEIKTKVIEITNDVIKYKEFDFLDGPLRNMAISDVFMIIYANGKREHFSEIKPVPTSEVVSEIPSKYTIDDQTNNTKGNFQKWILKNNPKQAYFSLATGYGNSYGGLGLRLQYVTGGKVRLGFHGGAGYFPNWYEDTFLYSGGIKFFFWHQLYINAQFGGFGVGAEQYYSSYWDYYEEDWGMLLGPSLLIGYDWFFSKNFGLNVGSGLSYDINRDTGIWFAMDGSLVFRF